MNLQIRSEHGLQSKSARHRFPDRRRGDDLQGVAFPEKKETENMVKIGVGQQDSLDQARTRTERAVAGMKLRKGVDLAAKIGRGVDEKPGMAVRGNGEPRLGQGGNPARPRFEAIKAMTIPLRQPPAGGGAEESDANRGSSPNRS